MHDDFWLQLYGIWRVRWHVRLNGNTCPEKSLTVIVVDPRRTKTVAGASQHLQLRPGSECALVLALLHVIIGEGLHDADFVRNWITGFDALAGHVRAFSPEWAESVTRVPAADIREAAGRFARSKPGCILWGNGIDTSINAFQTGRALLLLTAVTGNLDVPGGMVHWVGPDGLRTNHRLWTARYWGISSSRRNKNPA